ncbi:MAG: hypothetical protein QOI81_1120, partial [Actinomycetota bacterium]|nr:hypothetical protein [Actinomycetota bacterium]
ERRSAAGGGNEDPILGLVPGVQLIAANQGERTRSAG